MSKIICEICGTSYPETSAQCPICGCVKPVDTSAVIDQKNKTADNYTYVKGGRFSKKNVKKRTGGAVQAVEQAKPACDEKTKSKSNTTRILVITMMVLSLAIVAVGAYVAIGIFGDVLFPDLFATEAKTEPSYQVINIPCEKVTVIPQKIDFTFEGQELRLQVELEPVDTTDKLSYTTDNPEIVTVDNTGKVTAVSVGEAKITVTCGSVKVVCPVVCAFSDETVSVPVTEFKLNRSEFSFSVKGESWVLYEGEIPVTEVTWSSDDEKVATVENGKVIAVGKGTTKVHAEYDGKKYSCTVRCTFEDQSDIDEEQKLKISKTDVTIAVGEVFYLTLKDAEGKTVDVNWESSHPDTIEISGNKITGKAVTNYSKVKATYEGVEYSCIIRVKK